MQVLLLTDVKKVGQRGALVDVADGYAQNVLIPKKLARPATKEVLKQVESIAKERQAKELAEMERVKTLLSNVHGKTVEIKVNTNDSGVLFEAIHERQIQSAIRSALHVEIDEASIILEEPIKKAGQYEIKIEEKGSKAHLFLVVHK